MNQGPLEAGFLLHYRPYRDTSLLVELFTETQGRVSAIAKGARSPRSAWRGLLQPFKCLWVSWIGRSELMTLTQVESRQILPLLQGDSLLSGFYLNELLMRLLAKFDPHPTLFNTYHETLESLACEPMIPATLRRFEKQLLQELGYGLSLAYCQRTGQAVTANAQYYFDPHQGLNLLESSEAVQRQVQIFSGASLQAIHRDDFTCLQVLRDAKRLLRLALQPLLGNKPLHSRELFLTMTPPFAAGDTKP